MKIRQIDDDPTNLVKVYQIHSNGMAEVTEIRKGGLEEGDSYRIHKRHLEVPNQLKPRPQKIKFEDPLQQMKTDARPFGSAMGQYKPSYNYKRSA